MTFDPRFKETARAHDAVDRLREVGERVANDVQRTADRRDVLIRAVITAVIASVVIIAVKRL